MSATLVGTCDVCERDEVELEEVDLVTGDQVTGHVMMCATCDDEDATITWQAQDRAMAREASRDEDYAERQWEMEMER